MLSDMFDAYGERLVYAVLGLGLAFIALIVVLWLFRRRGGPAPFLKGGRNRQPRLQVLDATAVDARRRLVLVRRDNVEHLIMIGGPTDIVVESGIAPTSSSTHNIIPEPEHISQSQAATVSAQAVKPMDERAHNAAYSAPAPQISATEMVPEIQPTHPKQAETVVKAPPIEPAPAAKISSTVTKAAPPPQATAPLVDVRPAKMAEAEAQQRPLERSAEPQKPLTSPVTTAAMGPRATVVNENATLGTSPVSNNKPSFETSGRLEPVTQQQVDDIFDKARERVLPQSSAQDEISNDLRLDFESFLNAEIEKTTSGDFDGSLDNVATGKNPKQPISGATIDADAQQQMARIFGEMAVKRD